MAGHDRSEVARFQDATETRLVYARRKAEPTAEHFFLEDGRGGEPGLRAWVREHLECPMPECGDRRLRLVHRSGSAQPRRDGFSHFGGAGGHSPESVWHLTAKELIRRWAQARKPRTMVSTEVRLGMGARVADVLVMWPIARLAIEIQYSPLSVTEWRERHQWYVENGIAVVWLFGHAGTHLKQVHPGDGDLPPTFRFSTLHQTMAAEGVRFFWVNPLTEQLATPYVRRTLRRRPGRAWDTFVTADDDTFSLAVERMPTAGVFDNREGILPPRWLEILTANADYRQEKEVSDQEDAAEAAALADAKAKADRLRQERLQRLMQTAGQRSKAWGSEERPDGSERRPGSSLHAEARWRRLGGRGGLCRAPGCGLPLDPILLEGGYHYGCEPRDRQSQPAPSESGDDPQATLF